MANTRRQPPEKISADCPHCGFSQLESAFAKSTFCRKCGEHYSIEKLLAKEAGSLSAPGFFQRLSKIISRETIREISCFSCAATQQVSSAAESSQCPKCGSYIDLRDFKITGPFGRSIQTQGDVLVTSKGDLSSQRVLCGAAHIEGKVRGQIVCTGTASIKMHGQLTGAVEAQRAVIERRSDVELMKPLKAQSVEINGKTKGIVVCAGRVTINKHGSLEGAVIARSIVIEKGGIFSGELQIGDGEEVAVEPAVAVPAEIPQPESAEDDSGVIAELPSEEPTEMKPATSQEELFDAAPKSVLPKPGSRAARLRSRMR